MNQEINKGRKTMQFLKNIYFTVITMLFGAYILIKGIFRGLDVHKALKLHEQGKLDDALKKYEKFFKIFKKFDKKDKHLSQPNDILGAYYFNAALIYKIKNNITRPTNTLLMPESWVSQKIPMNGMPPNP